VICDAIEDFVLKRALGAADLRRVLSKVERTGAAAQKKKAGALRLRPLPGDELSGL
jgi:hypothetical protein